jgi:prefoldin subunit 5|tara:strand:- start:254 stop:439 length:186 start_codon:yes stop_codon:yes gene_type:complete
MLEDSTMRVINVLMRDIENLRQERDALREQNRKLQEKLDKIKNSESVGAKARKLFKSKKLF